MLIARNLSLEMGRRTLIDSLDWQVHHGEFWCVLGRNGAGKTTLLNTLAGVIPAASGELSLHDEPLQCIEPYLLARQRGLMPQVQSDSFGHSVFDTVVIARLPHHRGAFWNSSEDVDAVKNALMRTGLADRMGDPTASLSGGERQRVALAALLVQAPELMLLDEPVSHQDVAQQLEVMQLLRELSANHAVISSCHDINLARRFATHALVLGEGQHWLGSVGEILVPEILSVAFACEFNQQGDWLVPLQALGVRAR